MRTTRRSKAVPTAPAASHQSGAIVLLCPPYDTCHSASLQESASSNDHTLFTEMIVHLVAFFWWSSPPSKAQTFHHRPLRHGSVSPQAPRGPTGRSQTPSSYPIFGPAAPWDPCTCRSKKVKAGKKSVLFAGARPRSPTRSLGVRRVKSIQSILGKDKEQSFPLLFPSVGGSNALYLLNSQTTGTAPQSAIQSNLARSGCCDHAVSGVHAPRQIDYCTEVCFLAGPEISKQAVTARHIKYSAAGHVGTTRRWGSGAHLTALRWHVRILYCGFCVECRAVD